MFIRRKKWRVPAGQEPTALDRKVMALEARGAMVPKRSLIRTPEEIEGIKKSGNPRGDEHIGNQRLGSQLHH